MTSPELARKLRKARRLAEPHRIPLEAEDQVELVKQLRRARVLFFHVPNERKPQDLGRLKKMGLSAGVPDLIFVDPPPNVPGAPGAVLELKRAKGGTRRAAQERWIADFEARGWAAAIEAGLNAALARVRAWGYIP